METTAEDDLLLDDEPLKATSDSNTAPWVVLVVDDEPSVHDVTRLVLGNFRFEGRGLALLHASSAAEAEVVLRKRLDVAVVLLDVVMETDTAGLALTDLIRHELNNHRVRIVLRTGQASTLSETEVLRRYDINDYRQKTELTMQKLFGVLIMALRGYRDIQSFSVQGLPLGEGIT